MAKLTVEFRGLFSVILLTGQARMLLPAAYDPQPSRNHPDTLLPPFMPYLAVQSRLLPDDAPPPQFRAFLRKGHQENELRLRDTLASEGFRHELTMRREQMATPSPAMKAFLYRRSLYGTGKATDAGVLQKRDPEIRHLEQKGVEYSIYVVVQHRIDVVAMQAEPAALAYNSDDVPPTPDPYTNPHSMNWLIRLSQISPRSSVKSEALGEEPPVGLCAAYANLTKGSIQPIVHEPHIYRMVNGLKQFRRKVAEEVRGEAESEADTEIHVVDRLVPNNSFRISLKPEGEGPHVIIGNEPLDDILGLAPICSCAQPAYQFEKHYVFYQPMSRYPVPVCVNEDEGHLDPPVARCGPASLIG